MLKVLTEMRGGAHKAPQPPANNWHRNHSSAMNKLLEHAQSSDRNEGGGPEATPTTPTNNWDRNQNSAMNKLLEHAQKSDRNEGEEPEGHPTTLLITGIEIKVVR